MKQICYIFLLILITAAISTAPKNVRNRPRNDGIKVGNSCTTYDNKLGKCTKTTQACKEKLFHKKIVTRPEYRLLKNSRCGRYTVCCTPNINQAINRLLPNECGHTLINNRIFGGQITDINSHPWMALLKFKYYGVYGIQTLFSCGAALINDRYILTAAHCVLNSTRHFFINEIRLGEWDLESEQDCDNNEMNCDKPIDVGVENVIVHPNYNPLTNANDIALLRLIATVNYTYFIQPICLPNNENSQEINYFNKSLTVIGWGKTENGNSNSNKKLSTELLGANNTQCKEIFKTNFNRELNFSKQLCAGGDGKRDSCHGDSGGPLLYKINNIWTIVGIVSYGSAQCAIKGVPGIYTRVDGYIKWILKNIE